MLMSLELMLLAVNVNFILCSVYLDDFIGQIFGFSPSISAQLREDESYGEDGYSMRVKVKFGSTTQIL